MKKEMNFYWGNKTLSYMRYMSLVSFIHFNPDWKVNLILNRIESKRELADNIIEKQDKTEFNGVDYLDRVYDLGINIIEFSPSMIDLPEDVVLRMADVHIKDTLNWSILREGAGLACDMDVLFIDSVNKHIDDDADVGLICFDGNPQKDYIPASILYASKKNDLFEDAYGLALKLYNPKIYECVGTPCLGGLNISGLKEKYSQLNIQKLDDGIIFPYTNFSWMVGIKMIYEKDYSYALSKNASGIHWYGGTKVSQQFNNFINEDNIGEINNTLTVKIREII